MNKICYDILLTIKKKKINNQRDLAKEAGYSLGKINNSVKELQATDYIDPQYGLTLKSQELLETNKPKNAIILAAGFGLRMIPINNEIPKGLIKIYSEPIIERLITQLHQVNITDITIVVGYMKESYEYLIDKYHVKLKVNMNYAQKNNLHSLALMKDSLSNTYVIPCDVWCEHNPFKTNELYSWYMITEKSCSESEIRMNRNQELVNSHSGNEMVGIAYITSDSASVLANTLNALDDSPKYNHDFWELAFFKSPHPPIYGNLVCSDTVYEINTYDQLRQLDYKSEDLENQTLKIITEILDTKLENIENITMLKKGMTNRSFLFTFVGKKYIMRIPGAGTDKLINRSEEYSVYQAIKNLEICDDILYINPKTGYKLGSYFENSRVCDLSSDSDLKQCMGLLKQFHSKKLSVPHDFNIFKYIEYYESLREGQASCFSDYEETKKKVYELKEYIESQPKEWILCHIDAVPDNFLFFPCEKDTTIEQLRLIDWEYAGMQDPHVDIAMFAIYAMYDRTQIDKLIDFYFETPCTKAIRLKIYCYISICGFLWSNWCEFKRLNGVEFGEYALAQYRYAKEYYDIFKNEREEF